MNPSLQKLFSHPLLSRRVTEVMTTDVISVFANQQLGSAIAFMREHRISGVPVVSYDDICIGVLSMKDIIHLNPDQVRAKQVFTYMSTPAITASNSHTVRDVVGLLNQHRIHRVPIVDHYGRVVGIVSTLDLVGLMLDLQSEEPEEADAW